jgi:hypothetical protein
MTNWTKKIPLFVFAGVVYFVGQYLRGVWFLNTNIPNLCGHVYDDFGPFCNSPYLDSGWALIVAGEWFALIAAMMLFANARAWQAWFWFSSFFLPTAALITFGLFPQPFFEGLIEQDHVARIFGIIYTVVTLGIVLYTTLRKPRVEINNSTS